MLFQHAYMSSAERARVLAAGARVEGQRTRTGQLCKDGPLRIWMQDVQTPGMMVSRSLGDSIAHDELGVLAEPVGVAVESLEQGPAERRLAGADLARDRDEALPLLDSVEKMSEGLPV